MPDRVIRDEILQSDRWLDLPSDTHRLVYAFLILLADDYGNIKGGPRRLWRWMHGFTQLKTEMDAIKLMSDLQDAELVGRYEVEDKEFWHIHRFKNSRWYWRRLWPKSPFADDVDNKEKQRSTEKRNTPVANPLLTRREGVGVGVVPLRVPRAKNRAAHAASNGVATWNAYSTAYHQRYHVDPVRNAKVNSQIVAFCKRVTLEEAPHIAAFYVQHNQVAYVRAKHCVDLMLRDAEGLRTEWATNRPVTESEARLVDRTSGRANVFHDLIEEAQREGKS